MANASEQFLATLQQNPAQTAALDGLERELASAEDWDELVRVLTEYAPQQEDDGARVRLLFRAAHVARHMRGDEEHASELTEAAMSVELSGGELTDAIEGAFSPDEDWSGLDGALLDAMDFTDDAAVRARLLYKMGRVHEDRLFNRERAITRYHKAFKEDSTFTEPLAAARGICMGNESWETAGKLLKAEIKATRDKPRRAILFKELGDLQYEKLNDTHTALDMYRRAEKLDANVPGLSDAISGLEDTLGGEAEGVVISNALLGDDEADGGDDAAVDAAEAFGDEHTAGAVRGPDAPVVVDGIDISRSGASADSGDYALHLVGEAGDASGHERFVLMQRALAHASETGSSASDLVSDVVELLAGADDGVVAVQALVPGAWGDEAFWSALLSEAEAAGLGAETIYAICFYGGADRDRAAQLRPSVGAWGELENAALEFAEKGNWRKALGEFKDAYDHLGTSSETDLAAYRAQGWFAIGLGENDRATDAFRRILRKRKTDAEVLSVLARLYRDEQKWPALVDVLKKDVESTPSSDPQRQVGLYRELARLYRDELGQDVMVVNAYRSLLELEPTDTAATNELIALLRDMNRYPDLVDALRVRAENEEDPNERLAIRLEIADIFETKYANQNEAVVAWEDVAELDPQHRKALERLNELYERKREWEKLLDVRRRLFDLDGVPGGLVWIKESARLCATRMRDMDRAAQYWNEVREYAPDDADALQSLEQIHERNKDWESLANILEERVESIEDDEQRAQALLKLGQIRGDRLKDSQGALPAWQKLLALQPDNFRARESVKKGYIDLEDWDALEAFYAEDGNWQEYVRQLGTLAKQADDEGTQVDLLFRSVTTWTERLDTPERATRDLEKILTIEPDNGRAAAQLIPLYEARNDYRKLPDVLNIALADTVDSDARFGMLRQLGDIEVNHTRKPEEGLTHIREALELRPADNASVAIAEEAARKTEAWSQLAEVYADARAEQLGQGSEADWVETTRKYARLLEKEIGETDDALLAWDELLSTVPGDEEALAARERVFRSNGDWESLLGVLDARFHASEDTAEKIELQNEMAGIHHEQLGDPHRAIDNLQTILTLQPGDEETLRSLRGIYAAEGDWDAYIDTTNQLLEGREGADRTNLEMDVARVYGDEMGRNHDALSVLAGIVGRAPGHEDARARLEALLDDADEGVGAARVLEPLYRQAREWAPFVRVSNMQADATGDPARRAELRVQAARVLETELNDADAAFDAWQLVLRDEPGNAEAVESLERLAAVTGRWEQLVDLTEEVFVSLPRGDGSEQARVIAYGHRLATYRERELGDVDAAIGAHQQVLSVDPANRVSRDRLLGGLLEQGGRWQELVELIEDEERRAEDADAKRALLIRSARIREEALGDPDGAILVFQSLIADAPSDGEALAEMDRLYGLTGDAHARAQTVQQRLNLEPDAASTEALELRNRLADITDTELGDANTALTIREGILRDKPSDTTAREALQRSLTDEEHSARAAEILEPIYRSEEAWGELAELLDIRLRGTDDPAVRRTVALELDEISTQHLDDRARGLDVLSMIAAESPGDREVNRRLLRHADELEAWERVSGIFVERAQEVYEPPIVEEMLKSAAQMREDRLGDVEGAISAWQALIDVQPDNGDALAALDRLFGATAQWDEQVQILERRFEAAENTEGAVGTEWAFRASEVLQRELNRPDDAIDMLQRVLSRDPNNQQALDRLMEIYEADERWEALVDIAERKAATVESSDDARAYRMFAAEILETRLDDVDGASRQYASLLDSNPSDVEVIDRSVMLSERAERWDDLHRALIQRVSVVEGDEANDTLHRIAVLQENELGNVRAAVETYGQVLAADPSHGRTVDRLESMIERGDEVGAATELLVPLYERSESWRDVVRLNEVKAAAAFEPAARRELFARNADLLDAKLEDLEGSFASRTSALREQLVADDVERAAALVERSGMHAEWASLLAELRDEAMDPALRADLTRRLARVREERLDDRQGAIEAWMLLRDEAPEAGDSLVNLERLHEESGNWDSLNDILAQRAQSAQTAEERNALRLKRATVLSDGLDDPIAAIQEYRAVLSEDASNSEAVGRLEELAGAGIETREVVSILEPAYRAEERWDELVNLLNTQLTHEDSEDERFMQLNTIIALHREQTGDTRSEMEALGQAIRLQPGDPSLATRIDEIAAEEDAWSDAALVYSELLDSDIDDDARLGLSRRIARITTEEMDDDGAAEAAWAQVLSLDPEDSAALERLDDIYTRNEAWSELAEILRRRRALTFEPQAATALGHRHARVLRDQLDDIPGAIDVWNEVLETAPDNIESMQELQPLFEAEGRYEELFDLLDRRVMLTTDADERVELTRQQARVAQDYLDRRDEATDLWRRVYDAKNDDREALGQLALLYRNSGQADDLVAILRSQADIATDTDRESELRRQLGTLYADAVGNDIEAISAWERVVEIDGNDGEALANLSGLYERTGNDEKLAATIETRVSENLFAEDELVGAWETLGGLYSDRLVRPDDAIRSWSKVQELAPGHDEALDRLESLHLQTSNWPAYVEVLKAKAAATSDDAEKVDLWRRIASTWTSEAPDAEKAMDAWEQVLDTDPSNDEAFGALKNLYSGNEEWEALAGLTLDRAQLVEDEWDKRALLRETASLYATRLEQPEGAFLIMQSAVETAPLEAELRSELEQYAESAGKYEELADFYQTLVGYVAEDSGEDETLPLLVALGRIHDEKLDNGMVAEAFYDRAYAIDPESSELLDRLESIYRREEEWAPLVTVLQKRAELSFDPGQQTELHRQAARIQEEQLGDIPAAVESLRSALEIDETDTDAAADLERLLEEGGDWHGLVDALDRRAGGTFEPAELVPIRMRIGEVYRNEIGDSEKAIDAYRDVLMTAPNELAAIDALDELYTETESWDDLIDLQETRVSVDPDKDRQAEALIVQAQIQEAANGDVDAAISAYERALQVAPANGEALTQLIRIYTEQERPYELIQALERQAEHAEDPAVKVQALTSLGEATNTALGDRDKALASFDAALEIDDTHGTALTQAATLHGEAENWERSAQLWDRLAEVTPDAETRTNARFQAGGVLTDQLGRHADARRRFGAILEEEAENLHAHDELYRAHVAEGDYESAVSIMRSRIELTSDVSERSTAVSRIAAVYEQHLGQKDEAARLYTEAIDLDPTNVEAAEPYARLAMEQGTWERSRPLFELLIRERGDDVSPQQLAEWHVALGRSHEGLAAYDEAEQAYSRANELDPTNADALEMLAELSTTQERYDEAYNLYMDLLSVKQEIGAADSEIAGYYIKAGDVRLAEGDDLSAQQMYESAVAADSSNSEALERLVEVTDSDLDPMTAVSVRKQLLERTDDEETAFRLHVEIGDAQSMMGNAEEAVASYREALKIKRDSKVVLGKLLQIFREAGDWERATGILGMLADLESEPARKSIYSRTIGAMFRDELNDETQALHFFNQALDEDPSQLEVFEELNAMLQQSGDWEGLIKAYRKMIKRLKGDTSPDSLRTTNVLLRNLGEIYRVRTEQPEEAIKALESAVLINPNDKKSLETLAHLYETTGVSGPKMIEQHRRLLETDPLRKKSYRALFKAYLESDQIDRAWCMASGLAVVRKANEQEQGFYENGRSKLPAEPRKALSRSDWSEVMHPDLDGEITEIFAILANEVKPYVADIRDYNLHRRKDKMDPREQTQVMRKLQAAVRFLGVPEPLFYLKRDQAGFANPNTDPVAMLVGGDMIQSRPERELLFEAGRAVALMRPEFQLASALPSSEHLRVALASAVYARVGQVVGTDNTADVQAIADEIGRLPEPVRIKLMDAVDRMLNRGRNPDVSAWREHVDHTATRVGLLMSGDLTSALTALQSESNTIGKADMTDRIEAMISFGISETYMTLREKLMLTIGG